MIRLNKYNKLKLTNINNLNCNKKILFILIFIFVYSLNFSEKAHAANNNIIFEGYYKILSGQTPIGYTVQQYLYDDKKKQFVSTYYIRTNMLGGGSQESVRAVSTNSFQPVGYQYTARQGKATQTIDATFKKLGKKIKMIATLRKGVQTQRLDKVLPKGSFLSTFVGYLMLQNSYKVGTHLKYSAIAEEDGGIYSGEALVKEETSYKGQQVHRILNVFKGTKYISYVTLKGEVIYTKSPLQNLSTELVKTPAEATKGFKLDTKALTALFGRLPTGNINLYHPTAVAIKSPKSQTGKPVEVKKIPDATKKPLTKLPLKSDPKKKKNK